MYQFYFAVVGGFWLLCMCAFLLCLTCDNLAMCNLIHTAQDNNRRLLSTVIHAHTHAHACTRTKRRLTTCNERDLHRNLQKLFCMC